MSKDTQTHVPRKCIQPWDNITSFSSLDEALFSQTWQCNMQSFIFPCPCHSNYQAWKQMATEKFN
jgi:hypothetical protein